MGATVELSSSTLVVRHHLLTFVYSSRGGLEKALMVLPFQQVVYGLEQKGSALVGKPTLPQALLTNWKKRKQRYLSRFFFFFLSFFIFLLMKICSCIKQPAMERHPPISSMLIPNRSQAYLATSTSFAHLPQLYLGTAVLPKSQLTYNSNCQQVCKTAVNPPNAHF